MIHSSYDAYFAAAAAASGVLIGLLFVAVSMRSESIFGDGAAPSARAVSGSAFTALVNGFLVSFMALIPGADLGTTAAIMALVSLFGTIRLHRGLGLKSAPKVLLTISLVTYLCQFGIGIVLHLHQHEQGLVQDIAYLLIGSFAVALGRAWGLLQGKHTPSSPPQAS